MYLEAERLILRTFEYSDIDDLYEIFGDADVMEHVEPPYSCETAEEFLRDFCIERKPPGAYAVALKDTDKVIGYLLFRDADEDDVYQIGWIFNSSYWGKGYSYEACSALIRYGFETICLHKICADTVDTVKSVALMEKLGMTQEGIRRKHSKSWKSNLWEDMYEYAILREDYLGAK